MLYKNNNYTKTFKRLIQTTKHYYIIIIYVIIR